jgi:ankyrin repeat protein
MMSIFLTEELENHTACKSDAEMLFFFCSAQDEKRNTGVAVLRGILYQIIAKRPQLIRHALPYFKTPERTQQTLLSLETLWIIFTKLVADTALGIMFCVLDGLDECDESTTRVLLLRIVGFLTDKTSSTTGMFRMVVVSREIHALQGCRCSRIRLDPDNDAKVDGDIQLFVSTRVQKLSGIEGFNNDFRSFVQASLLQRAEGTFLWVGFAMYELSQKKTCSEILEVLEDLPTGLPAIYNRMLLQIPARHREVSQAILRWVTMAVRPLQLEELAAAVGLHSRHSQLTTGQVVRDAVTRCGPLLKIHEQNVSLVHQSMRDYLLREECDGDTVLDAFRLRKESSHLELAQKCLDCLAQSSLQHNTIYQHEIDSSNSPLFRYAIFNWPEHAKHCSTLAARLIDPHGFFLKKTSPLRMHWWDIYNGRFVYSVESPELLHLACSLEIISWVEAVLSKKRWMPRSQKRVNKRAKGGQTALHHAALSKDIALVQLLLNKGADIKAEDNNRRTALHIATKEGNTAVVQLLLDQGADANAKDLRLETALHVAARKGNTAVVQLLLDRGADVNAKDWFGSSVLHAAAFPGISEAVVQLLLDRGADINALYQFGNSALHAAALTGSEAVVQLLLERGAIVKARDRDGETPLHLAAMLGHKAVVQLLLDRGANIEVKSKFGKTALHLSAEYEEEDIVYFLLDRGADVNAKDNDGNTALQKAMVGRSGKPWTKTNPAKRKAICDFLRSRMEPSEI